eukprot:1957650-Rhodomonas_salina.1
MMMMLMLMMMMMMMMMMMISIARRKRKKESNIFNRIQHLAVPSLPSLPSQRCTKARSAEAHLDVLGHKTQRRLQEPTVCYAQAGSAIHHVSTQTITLLQLASTGHAVASA